MKYEKPEYVKAIVETEDILTLSTDFEITSTNEGEGKIQFDFLSLFGR